MDEIVTDIVFRVKGTLRYSRCTFSLTRWLPDWQVEQKRSDGVHEVKCVVKWAIHCVLSLDGQMWTVVYIDSDDCFCLKCVVVFA